MADKAFVTVRPEVIVVGGVREIKFEFMDAAPVTVTPELAVTGCESVIDAAAKLAIAVIAHGKDVVTAVLVIVKVALVAFENVTVLQNTLLPVKVLFPVSDAIYCLQRVLYGDF